MRVCAASSPCTTYSDRSPDAVAGDFASDQTVSSSDGIVISDMPTFANGIALRLVRVSANGSTRHNIHWAPAMIGANGACRSKSFQINGLLFNERPHANSLPSYRGIHLNAFFSDDVGERKEGQDSPFFDEW